MCVYGLGINYSREKEGDRDNGVGSVQYENCVYVSHMLVCVRYRDYEEEGHTGLAKRVDEGVVEHSSSQMGW